MPMSESTRCCYGEAPERCCNGILHTNDYNMSEDALSRRAAPRRSAPGLSTARRGGEGWCAAAPKRLYRVVLRRRTARGAPYSLKQLRCGAAPHCVDSLYADLCWYLIAFQINYHLIKLSQLICLNCYNENS
jgi:hypothetical protein